MNILERIVGKLLSGKFIMTVAFTITTCHLAWVGLIPIELFVPMTTAIIGFYFAQSIAKGKTNV